MQAPKPPTPNSMNSINASDICPLPPTMQQDNNPPPYSYNIPPEEEKPNNVSASTRNDFKPNNAVSCIHILMYQWLRRMGE